MLADEPQSPFASTYQPGAGWPAPADGAPTPGDALRWWLASHDMSQAEFARRVAISAKHVNSIIRNRARYSSDTAQRIAEVTGTAFRYWWRLQYEAEARERDQHPTPGTPPTPRPDAGEVRADDERRRFQQRRSSNDERP